MYENMTFEYILGRMLDRVTADIDTTEGSLIYTALAPAAFEFAEGYKEMDSVYLETFADTASRENLIKRGAERGKIPYPATCAVLKGVFEPAGLEIPIGSRFTLQGYNYAVTEKISSGVYKLACETSGIVGNQSLGVMSQIDYIDGLTSATLTELLIPGEDEEETEAFRKRYFDSFSSQAYGGNEADYLEKTNAINGVGATKVTPAWNGGGTVKLTILTSEHAKAGTTLISEVQQAIDPTQSGAGKGLAPIGHIVTVDTVAEVTVNVTATITYSAGYTFQALQEQITSAIQAYFLDLRKGWANEEYITVRISQLEARLLTITGILDISNTKFNDVASNLVLTAYQVPVFGTVTA